MACEKICMCHLDLFSGIGGFAYAARVVWGKAYRNVGFCEIDSFCQSVLRKNFPDCKIYGDIRILADGSGERLEGSDRAQPPFAVDIGRVDLVTGGFPCQPFSVAGRRRGTSDDRYLWPEMFRVIQRFKPTWVIGENVGGLVTWNEGMVLEQVCSDLESEGYEVQPFIIPACAVNAPHRRDRVWIIAHFALSDDRGNTREFPQTDEQQAQERQKEWVAQFSDADKLNATNSNCQRSGTPKHEIDSRQQASASKRQNIALNRVDGQGSYDWDTDWKEIALATCHGRVDDGLSKRLVRLPLGGSPIGYARWRKEALKSYGNAIVPQVAMMIMEAIKGV